VRELGLPRLGPSRLAGYHCARWLPGVRSVLADRHLVDVVTELRDCFEVGSYLVLTEAMNSYEIGRGRGGTIPALRRMGACSTIVAVDSEWLFPLRQQVELADLLGVERQVIRSQRGHDSFLVEVDQINAVLADALT
jgi:homoserine acetyltransferase